MKPYLMYRSDGDGIDHHVLLTRGAHDEVLKRNENVKPTPWGDSPALDDFAYLGYGYPPFGEHEVAREADEEILEGVWAFDTLPELMSFVTRSGIDPDDIEDLGTFDQR